jgi:hypothetical protein
MKFNEIKAIGVLIRVLQLNLYIGAAVLFVTAICVF